MWGRHEGAWGGRLLPWCGATGVGRSSDPDLSSVRACGRGPLPTGCGCLLRAWGPVTNPAARALASWLCALWGQHEGAWGGAPLAWVWGVRGRALSHYDLSSVWACGRGPLHSGCGCGGCGRGDPSPIPKRALLRAGFARCGGGMRVPGGGASCLGVGRPGTGALPPPTSCSLGRAAGAHYPLAVGAGDAGVGTCHQPHSARSCALLGRHEGARGGRLLPGCGASGVRRSPTHYHSSFRACGRGPLPTGCGCGGCGRGEPSPTPQRALLQAGFARCGGGTRAPEGGGGVLAGCGASGDARSPTPDPSCFWACGRGPLPTRCGRGVLQVCSARQQTRVRRSQIPCATDRLQYSQ